MAGITIRLYHGVVWTALVLFALALPLDASSVRVATFNVHVGVGSPGNTDYRAVSDILERIDADVIAFQELNTSDRPNWETLVGTLGYAHTSFSAGSPLSGNLNTGYASRWPILDTFNVLSAAGANEITRPPFRTVVDVPGTLRPLTLWTLHHKALSGANNQFRRAVEARRCRENVTAYLQQNPENDEIVILGDFNDDVGRSSSQPESFSALPSGLPQSYSLGADITFPVAYRTFPRDAYEPSGPGLNMLSAFQEDSSADDTFITSGRLDYIFVSDRIWNQAAGTPLAEVYNSARDDGLGGLPKTGIPLPSGTSADASDHFPVFADVHLEDEDVLGTDGVGKAWRKLHFGHFDPEVADASRAGDDPDFDGLTNLGEFIADTQPTNDISRFVIDQIDLVSGAADVHFRSSTGRIYTVQYKDDLLNPEAWSSATDLNGVYGNGGVLVYRDDGSGTAPPSTDHRSYRVRVERPPDP